MFLKSLTISNEKSIIRDIQFHKGINLIVDETKTKDRQESGNNVGKTTILRLIDFCLGGKGDNIYKDPEFKDKGNNTIIENFLKTNNVIITLILKENLDISASSEIVIKRNFLNRKDKIQEINNENLNNSDFQKKLKQLIFNSSDDKPTFRQIISKNIRDEKNRLLNTIKVLHPTTTREEYEALYLFWLGISIDDSDRKQKLLSQIKLEENLHKRLRKDSNHSQIEQALIIVNRDIVSLEEKKDSFNLNESYEDDLRELNAVKSEINKTATQLSRLELRKELIDESKKELEKEIADINIEQIKSLYEEAKVLIPNIQKSFEDTLKFHNQMLIEKSKYITMELPEIESEILSKKRTIDNLLLIEKQLTNKLQKTDTVEELQSIITQLNKAYERKGNLEELKKMWENSFKNLESYNEELKKINEGISSKDDLIKERIIKFNEFFSVISLKLYGEQFVLSSDKNDKGYELNISTISGNLGTGKKKGQIAAFDLAYIQFAESIGIDFLHFILNDQIENVHNNQITSLLNEIVSNINCQYVLPVLRDKLPDTIDVKQYEILSLSQSNKLFKIE